MKNILYLLSSLLLITGCARIVTPVGGPADVEPPKIDKELPTNLSTDFNSKLIKITFNEFVTLNSPNDNIFFSPPLTHKAEYSLSGKSLFIKLNDTLLEGKTYNIVFSNAIKDFTEGNILNLYQYTFSTGSYIDSFMVSGKIINAETTLPEKNISIFLYDHDVDSLPLTKKPTYITKSQEDGTFTFRHIAAGEYKLFALKDINANLIYDLPNESIAFSNATVTAQTMPKEIKPDSLSPDSIDLKSIDKDTEAEIVLSFFTAEDTVQRLQKPLNPQKGIYQIIYKRPFNSFETKQLEPEESYSYVEVMSSSKDTITWYFKENFTDTLIYQTIVDGTLIDTIKLLPYKEPVQRGRGTRKENQARLTVSYHNQGNLYAPLTLSFSTPILPVDSFAMTVIQSKKSGNDTTTYHYTVPDTFVISLPLPFPLEEKVPYILYIKDSVFTGYNGLTNDSIAIRFSAKSEKDFGNLIIDYKTTSGKEYIVSLLNANGHTIQTDIVNDTKQIKYMHLIPGEYKIKVIEDSNKNGKWDTGNYQKNIQPEKVFFFEKPISIRGYWDLEEVFLLEE